jgi:hypothetical protein
MNRDAYIALAALALPLGGCVSTAVSLVTLPVKVAAKTVDILTTSQSEKDRKRGRELRKQEERDRKDQARLAKEERKRQRGAERAPDTGQ